VRQHYVVFLSPGTFVDETDERSVKKWDPKKALAMAEEIQQRHGARPYAFYFETRIVAGPISDGEGGTLTVEPKTVAKSGVHFIDGKLRTIDQIEERADPREAILLSNMRCNDWPIACVTTRSWKHVGIFEERDFVVAPDGAIIERGDDPKHVAYRAKVKARKEPR
jgi:hypothetical protein